MTRLCRRKNCYFAKVGGPHSHALPPAKQGASCGACGLAWEDHLGIATTCARLRVAEDALRLIHHKTVDPVITRLCVRGLGLGIADVAVKARRK